MTDNPAQQALTFTVNNMTCAHCAGTIKKPIESGACLMTSLP